MKTKQKRKRTNEFPLASLRGELMLLEYGVRQLVKDIEVAKLNLDSKATRIATLCELIKRAMAATE